MVLTLDKMAERYGLLPSQVLNQGSTFDLYIMDAAISYNQYSQRKQDGSVTQDYSIDELQSMLDGVKKK